MTLVLLHGFTGGPASWDPVVERLGSAGQAPSRIAPHLTGHGPDPVFVKDFDAEVQRLCERVAERADPPVHLAAYSMGARVALAMLVARPALFHRATLIGVRDGLADARDRDDRARWERRWIQLLEEKGIRAFLEAWEALPLWDTQESAAPELRAAQRRIRGSNTASGLAHAMRVLGLSAMAPLGDRLGRVTADVALMAGALDPKFGRLAEPLARAIPRTRRLTVEAAGHNLLLERPDAVADALNRNGSG